MFLFNMCWISLLLTNFLWSSTHLNKCPALFPIIPIVQLTKNMGTQKNFSTFQKTIDIFI